MKKVLLTIVMLATANHLFGMKLDHEVLRDAYMSIKHDSKLKRLSPHRFYIGDLIENRHTYGIELELDKKGKFKKLRIRYGKMTNKDYKESSKKGRIRESQWDFKPMDLANLEINPLLKGIIRQILMLTRFGRATIKDKGPDFFIPEAIKGRIKAHERRKRSKK